MILTTIDGRLVEIVPRWDLVGCNRLYPTTEMAEPQVRLDLPGQIYFDFQ